MSDTQFIEAQLHQVYRHAKGGLYRVLLIGRQEADQTDVVIYQSLDTRNVWVRPLAEFCAPRFTPFPDKNLVAYRVRQQEEAFGFYRLSLTPAYRGKYRDFRSSIRFALSIARNNPKPVIP